MIRDGKGFEDMEGEDCWIEGMRIGDEVSVEMVIEEEWGGLGMKDGGRVGGMGEEVMKMGE